jgi:hypothetical protein
MGRMFKGQPRQIPPYFAAAPNLTPHDVENYFSKKVCQPPRAVTAIMAHQLRQKRAVRLCKTDFLGTQFFTTVIS